MLWIDPEPQILSELGTFVNKIENLWRSVLCTSVLAKVCKYQVTVYVCCWHSLKVLWFHSEQTQLPCLPQSIIVHFRRHPTPAAVLRPGGHSGHMQTGTVLLDQKPYYYPSAAQTRDVMSVNTKTLCHLSCFILCTINNFSPPVRKMWSTTRGV